MKKTLLTLVGLLTVFVLAGCDSDDATKTDCNAKPAITFLSPTSESLTEFNDANDNPDDGIQVSVRAQTRFIPAGTRVVLTRGDTQLEGNVVLDGQGDLQGQVDFGEVTFAEGTDDLCAAAGAFTVDSMADGSTSCHPKEYPSLHSCKEVQVVLGKPACRFDSPDDGATLTEDGNADELGFQTDVVLACKGVNDGEAVKLFVGDRLPLQGSLANKSLTFEDVDLAEGTNVLRVETTGQDDSKVQAEIGVTVDTGRCAVALLPADGTKLRAADDTDLDTAGLQVAFTVRTDAVGRFVCADGSAVTLLVGADRYEGSLADGQATLVATLTDGLVEVHAEVEEPGGGQQSRSLIHRYFVCFTAVEIAIDAPGAGLTIFDTADAVEEIDGIQIEVNGTYAGAVCESLRIELNGQTVCDNGVPQDTCADAPLQADCGQQGRFSFEHISFLDSGEYQLQVKGANACTDAGESPVQSHAVFTDQLTCQIVEPENGAVLNTADDKDGNEANGLQADVIIQTANVPDGHGFRLTVSGQAEVVGTISGNAWTGEIDFEDDESKNLQCILDAGPRSPMVTIRVDNHAPTVAITSPSDGSTTDLSEGTVCFVTTDVADGLTATVTVSDGNDSTDVAVTVNDNQACADVNWYSGQNTATVAVSDTGGNQATDAITVTAMPCSAAPQLTYLEPNEGQPQPIHIAQAGDYTVRVQVTEVLSASDVGLTLIAGGIPGSTLNPDRFAGGVAEFDVTFVNGPLVLSVSASNSCGSTDDHRVELFVGPMDAPSIVISEPPSGHCTNDPVVSISAQTTNVVPETPNPVCYFCVRQSTAGTPPDCTPGASFAQGPIDASGACTASLTVPSADDWQIWATVTNLAGHTSSSVPVEVVYDQTAPVVTFDAPNDATVFNAASPDTDPAPGFQIQVVVSHNESHAVTVGSFYVDGSDAEVVAGPQFESGLVTYPAVTLADGDHNLEIEICDCAGNCATATPVGVSVDRQVPQVTLQAPQDGALLGANADSDMRDGFQHNVVCNFSQAAVGDRVTLSRNVDSGGWQLVRDADGQDADHLLQAGELSSYTFYAATLLDHPATSGSVQLRCRVEDPAGNSDQHSVSVTINTDAPTVDITEPNHQEELALSADFCAASGFQTQVTVTTTNTANGDTLMVCECQQTCPPPDTGSSDLCAQEGYGQAVWTGEVAGATTYINCVDFHQGDNILRAFTRNAFGGSTFSSPITVYVDSTPPTVDAVSVTSDGDGNGCVSAAEGDLVVQVTVSDPAPGRALTGRTVELVRDWPFGSSVGSGSIDASGVAEIVLPSTLADGVYDLTATFTDTLGNPNIKEANPVIDDPEATFTVEKDHTPPTITITNPTKTDLNRSDDLDTQTEDLDFNFTVNVTGAAGQDVTFNPMGQTATVNAGGVAVLLTSIGQGQTTLEALVSDACGNPATPASKVVDVDTIPPTIICSQPSSDSSFTEQTITFICTTTGAGTSEEIVIDSSLGDQCRQNVDVSETTTIPCTVSEGTHDFDVTVTDAAGNPSTPFAINNVVVDITGCPVDITSHSGFEVFNLSDDKNATPADGLQIDITACSTGPEACNATNCSPCRAWLRINGGQVRGPEPLDASGCVVFADVTFADDERGTLVEVEIDDNATGGGGNLTSDNFTVRLVDLVAPSLSVTAPSDDRTIYCVAAAGNPNVDDQTYYADKNGGTLAICEMDFSFIANEDKASATFPAQLTLTEGAATLAGPYGITDTGDQPVTFLNVELSHDATHALVATLEDFVGNQATATFDVVVDVSPPAVIPNVAAALHPDLDSSRKGKVNMSWDTVGDDSNGAGSPAAYEVRWARSAIADQTAWAAAQTTYTGADTTVGLSGLPPLNTYHFAVRAVDEVGNLSDFHSDVALDNLWSEFVYLCQGVCENAWFGYDIWGIGDVNNDGYDDLAVSASGMANNQGVVFVYYGRDNIDEWNTTAPPQTLSRFSSGEYFGDGVTRGGDFSGDGIDDLAVGGDGYSAWNGRVTLYFGTSDGSPLSTAAADIVEIRGGNGAAFGFTVEIIGDIGGGPMGAPDGIADLAITEYYVAYGNVYIFYGRSKSDWKALEAAAPAGYIPASARDVEIRGHDVNDRFSYYRSVAGIGDLDSDGHVEFAMGASRINTVSVFDGAATSAAVSPLDAEVDAEVILQEGPTPYTDPDNFYTGFGCRMVGGADVTGNGKPDLVVSSSTFSRVFLFEGLGNSMSSSPARELLSGWKFGWDIAVEDVNMDNVPDLVAGTNSTSGNRVFVYVNNGTNSGPQAYFDDAPSSTLSGVEFYGISVATGDFNADGLPDIAVGSLEQSGGPEDKGALYVYH